MIINNIEFQEPIFNCSACGGNKLSYRYVESNKSIQARCSGCDKWHGNIKYDKRDNETIKKDKISEWLERNGEK